MLFDLREGFTKKVDVFLDFVQITSTSTSNYRNVFNECGGLKCTHFSFSNGVHKFLIIVHNSFLFNARTRV